MLNLLKIYKDEFGVTKKHFGQHFLTSTHILDALTDASGADEGVNVVEIGPGCGVLTERMIERGADLLAVEIDNDLVKFLKKFLFIYDNFTIINKDFLKIEQADIPFEKFNFAGNLPYNLSVDILIKCTEFHERTDKLVFMFQKEVADRVNAVPKTKQYSSVSVICSYFYKIKKLRDISGGQFWPNTKVTSTVLEFYPKELHFTDLEKERRFLKFVRECFVMKRKTLRNNLKKYEGLEDAIVKLGFKDSVRAEEIDVKGFIDLFEELDVL